MEKRKTVKQIIAEINENKKSMFDFEGFNQKKHEASQYFINYNGLYKR